MGTTGYFISIFIYLCFEYKLTYLSFSVGKFFWKSDEFTFFISLLGVVECESMKEHMFTEEIQGSSHFN